MNCSRFGTAEKRLPKQTVQCPECLYRRLRSTDSIPRDDGALMRRRTCQHCGHKWNTVEQIDGPSDKTKF